MSFVVGFDLSLKGPAAVALPLDWQPGDWSRVLPCLLNLPERVPRDAPLEAQFLRYSKIVAWVLEVVDRMGDVPLYVEDYGFHTLQSQDAAHIVGCGELVKYELWTRHRLLTPLPSSTARKVFLGFAPRRPKYRDPKKVVQDALRAAGAPLREGSMRTADLQAAAWHKPQVRAPGWDENVCDAWVIANAALDLQGGRALKVDQAVEHKAPKPSKTLVSRKSTSGLRKAL